MTASHWSPTLDTFTLLKSLLIEYLADSQQNLTMRIGTLLLGCDFPLLLPSQMACFEEAINHMEGYP